MANSYTPPTTIILPNGIASVTLPVTPIPNIPPKFTKPKVGSVKENVAPQIYPKPAPIAAPNNAPPKIPNMVNPASSHPSFPF